MEYQGIMHIAFYTDQFETMIDFYTNKLGGKLKTIVRYGLYKGRKDRPQMLEKAEKEPDRIMNAYVELAPKQFIEIFPAHSFQKPAVKFNEHQGYSHFALIVDDIFEARKELEERGIVFTSEI
ncbi:MAG: VOC family protein [Holdemania massiliensis]